MDNFDLAIVRLQYEILATPLTELAKATNIPLAILDMEVKKNDWQVKWPDELKPQSSDEYTQFMQKRLQVYNLAKQAVLALKYTSTEAAIINKAMDMVEDTEDPSALRNLAGTYKDLASLNTESSGVKAGLDDNGMPYVVIRDLSGGSE